MGRVVAHQIMEIFSLKTAPSFEVVFRLGAMCGKAGDEVHDVLKTYSEAVGVAYQIQDDLADFTETGDVDDIRMSRPSIMMAMAHDQASDAEKHTIADVWGRDVDADQAAAIHP